MLILDALRKQFLDVRFRACPGAWARVVERPGLWMDPAAQQRLVQDIRTVIQAGVPDGSLDYGVVSDPGRLNTAILTVVYRESDGRPVAFNALQVLDCELRGERVEVIHLGLLMVDPVIRHSGLTGVLYGSAFATSPCPRSS